MKKEELKELFLNLTQTTIPFGHEEKLEKYLPKGFKRDEVGNYYYEIGESETLFTTHLDTYSKKFEEVNHVIDSDNPYIIRTDGKTILGGDNKLGCSILIGMIKNNIPGVYYFFLGEEPIISGGLWGSEEIFRKNPEYFQKFKRTIAFDRRTYGSIVQRQLAETCASDEFVEAIAANFEKYDIQWDESSGCGYYTDTATFLDVIPECTNISAGGFNEHLKNEWVNLNYTYKVLNAALNTDWESLPTKRKIEDKFFSDNSNSNNSGNVKLIEAMFSIVDLKQTRNTLKSGVRHMTFSEWLEFVDYQIVIKDNEIFLSLKNDFDLNDESKVTLDEVRSEIVSEYSDVILKKLNYYLNRVEKNPNAVKSLRSIMYIFGQKDISEFFKILEEIEETKIEN